jgi:hypothetical protein
VRFLTFAEAIELHRRLIERSGGAPAPAASPRRSQSGARSRQRPSAVHPPASIAGPPANGTISAPLPRNDQFAPPISDRLSACATTARRMPPPRPASAASAGGAARSRNRSDSASAFTPTIGRSLHWHHPDRPTVAPNWRLHRRRRAGNRREDAPRLGLKPGVDGC